MSARGRGRLHGHDFIAFHGGLQGADGIDFRHHHAAAGLAQRSGRAFAHIAEARNHGDLAGHHHVGAAADAVHQRLAAAIEIVEFGLGDAVIDVDGGEQQLVRLFHQIEAMHAGGGFFRHALDAGGDLGEPALGLFLQQPLDEGVENFLFLIFRLFQEGRVALFGAQAVMHQHGGVAAIVQDHVGRAAAVPFEQLGGVVPIVLQALALDGEDRNARRGDGGGGMILGRIDVARHPADIGAQRLQGLDQHRGLDGHVQRAGDARALQGLRLAVFGAGRHQAGHLDLGDVQLLAAPFGQADVLDDVIAESFGRSGGHGRIPAGFGPPIAAGPGYGKEHIKKSAYDYPARRLGFPGTWGQTTAHVRGQLRHSL